jgi:predicted enzyme related to lactoylglutathione lyase
MTSDPAKATAFYTQLFAWETAPMPGMAYTIFRNGTDYAGGMLQAAEGRPSMWVPYVTVADTDASAAAAVKLGATLCMEPADIPNVGRIAVLTDPAGATFGLWAQAKE